MVVTPIMKLNVKDMAAKNIFEQAASSATSSFRALDTIARILRRIFNLICKLMGTDNVGSAKSNQKLSENE
jgi:hypothetical protein